MTTPWDSEDEKSEARQADVLPIGIRGPRPSPRLLNRAPGPAYVHPWDEPGYIEPVEPTVEEKLHSAAHEALDAVMAILRDDREIETDRGFYPLVSARTRLDAARVILALEQRLDVPAGDVEGVATASAEVLEQLTELWRKKQA